MTRWSLRCPSDVNVNSCNEIIGAVDQGAGENLAVERIVDYGLYVLRDDHRPHAGIGAQTDYCDFPNVFGWSREGGAAVVISNGDWGWKHMKAGIPGQVYIDLLGNRTEEIVIDEWGWADFTCNGGSVSVWVPKE